MTVTTIVVLSVGWTVVIGALIAAVILKFKEKK